MGQKWWARTEVQLLSGYSARGHLSLRFQGLYQVNCKALCCAFLNYIIIYFFQVVFRNIEKGTFKTEELWSTLKDCGTCDLFLENEEGVGGEQAGTTIPLTHPSSAKTIFTARRSGWWRSRQPWTDHHWLRQGLQHHRLWHDRPWNRWPHCHWPCWERHRQRYPYRHRDGHRICCKKKLC